MLRTIPMPSIFHEPHALKCKTLSSQVISNISVCQVATNSTQFHISHSLQVSPALVQSHAEEEATPFAPSLHLFYHSSHSYHPYLYVYVFLLPRATRGDYESILGGDLESLVLPLPNGDALRLCSVLVSIELAMGFPFGGNGTEIRRRAYDLLLSPSFLNPSMVLNISFLPPLASMSFPPILIETFSLAFALRSLLRSKCLIWMQT